MKRSAKGTILALTCLAIALVAAPVPAQAAGVSVDMMRTNTSTVAPGSVIGVSALVVNHGSGKARGTVTLTQTSACGTSKTIGYYKYALSAGQGIWVTISDGISSTACAGTYVVSANTGSGGASVSFLVQ